MLTAWCEYFCAVQRTMQEFLRLAQIVCSSDMEWRASFCQNGELDEWVCSKDAKPPKPKRLLASFVSDVEWNQYFNQTLRDTERPRPSLPILYWDGLLQYIHDLKSQMVESLTCGHYT